MELAEREDIGFQISHDRDYMLDVSNRQGMICHRYSNRFPMWDTSNMDVGDIDVVRKALISAMARKDVKPTTLSLRLGNNKSLVKQLLETTKDVKLSTLSKLAGELDVHVSELVGAETPTRPWVPDDNLVAKLLEHVLRVSSADPRKPNELPIVAAGLGAGLRSLARSPANVNDSGYLKAVFLDIEDALADRPPLSSQAA